jgi:hypothetical protein
VSSATNFRCFCCVTCGAALEATGYFEVAGDPYCADHYVEVAGRRCSVCDEVQLKWFIA